MDDIELVKQKINIVDLIQEYLPIKKAGVNFKALCPFHTEKTPSFFVSPERQIWRCFGCLKSGDIFTFLMEKEGMDFKEALEILAKKAGVVLKKRLFKKDQRDRLYEANLKAQEFFHYLLTKHPFGKEALGYLKNRGVASESIEAFGLGYAPNSWESLAKFLLKRGFTNPEITTTGLAVSAGQSFYDRFRGRITFPLIDQRDKIVSFSGRVVGDPPGGGPKYINTPQTLIFDKSNFLYGIHRSKSEIKVKNEVILVEGEMDVILSYQTGVKNVAASKGTALTLGQIELLKKYTQNISLCFDTDLAGDEAARRGIEMADRAGFNIKVIPVALGKDPAEMIKNKPQKWPEAILEAIPIYDFYLQSITRRYNPADPAGIRQISGELIPIWAKISDDLVRERYIQKLAALLKVDEQIIRLAVQKIRQTQSQSSFSQILRHPQKDEVLGTHSYRELLEEYLIALLLHLPKDHIFVPSFPETLLVSETLRQIYVLLVLYLDSISFKGGSFDINEFVKGVPAETLEVIDKLYLIELDQKLFEGKNWQKELNWVITGLKKTLIKASLERLSLEIKNAQEFGKIELIESLNRRFRDLSIKLKNL